MQEEASEMVCYTAFDDTFRMLSVANSTFPRPRQLTMQRLAGCIMPHEIYHTVPPIYRSTGETHQLCLHALSGRACNFKAAGLMKPQNVMAPISTQAILVR